MIGDRALVWLTDMGRWLPAYLGPRGWPSFDPPNWRVFFAPIEDEL
jgi:hypothetical protein